MEPIEDPDYLEKIRQMGVKDFKKLSEVVGALRTKLVAGSRGSGQEAPREKTTEVTKKAVPKLKLDAVALPHFSGEHLRYPEFKREFLALIGGFNGLKTIRTIFGVMS